MTHSVHDKNCTGHHGAYGMCLGPVATIEWLKPNNRKRNGMSVSTETQPVEPRVTELEAEVKELKRKLKAAGKQHGRSSEMIHRLRSEIVFLRTDPAEYQEVLAQKDRIIGALSSAVGAMKQ